MRWFVLVLIFVLASAAAQAAPAPLISLGEGTYRAIAPPDWDGKSALPLVLYLHGFREDSAQIAANTPLIDAVTALGALLVIPDGVDQSWSFHGAPSRKRDDIAFLHRVVAAAEARWPVDRTRVFVAGFSVGGSMVWELACHGAEGFAAFLPFSGDFWQPYPTRCETGPINLRHTHAINDHTFPMTGRPLRGGEFHQGDLYEGLAVLKATDGCAAVPDKKATEDALDCERWTACSSRKELELCLHHGDHQIEPDWLRDSILWAMQRVAAKG